VGEAKVEEKVHEKEKDNCGEGDDGIKERGKKLTRKGGRDGYQREDFGLQIMLLSREQRQRRKQMTFSLIIGRK